MGSARAEARTLKPQGGQAVVVEVPCSAGPLLNTGVTSDRRPESKHAGLLDSVYFLKILQFTSWQAEVKQHKAP